MLVRFRLIAGFVLLSTVFLATALARAQTLNEGWKSFDDKYRKVTGRIRGFFSGAERVDPSDKSAVDALDLHARYYTYGVYLRTLELELATNKGINADYRDFVIDVDKIINSKDPETVQGLKEVYRKEVRLRALDVLQFDKARSVHKVHNARLLAKIAELGEGELVDALVPVLKDAGQNDGVRYYVLRALGTLLAQVQPMQTNPVLTKQQEAKAIEALVDFLDNRKGPSNKASPEEIDGFRLLRREAVRALAHVRTPTVSEKVRPALVLARFVGTDERIQPPPRLDERVEAAYGLARMATAKDNQYQADYAAGQIAKFLGAFAQAYSSGEREKKGLDRSLPWLVAASRLKESLAVLETESGKNTYVAEVVKRGGRVLEEIKLGKPPSNVFPADVTWLVGPDSEPPSRELFKGSADSVVKPGEGAEAEPRKKD
jgi:hypothetical protein